MAAIIEQDYVLTTGNAVYARLDRLRRPVEKISRVSLVQSRTGHTHMTIETWPLLAVDGIG
ncbi:MAG: hypothetical protein WA484_11455 [Solirubrobacteraceae bacterium]